MLDEFNNVNKPINNPALRTYDTSVQQDLAYVLTRSKEAILSLNQAEIIE